MGAELRYPTDLNDSQWDRVSHLIPEPKKGGRPAKYAHRDVTDALMYVQRNRCSWLSLPDGLPPWRVAYWYYAQWKRSGVLDRVLVKIGNRAQS
jgi:transposase